MSNSPLNRFDLDRVFQETRVARVEYSESCPSTNDGAIELVKARQAAPLPLLVLTSLQTKGRGQREREWQAHWGSLTFSLVLSKSDIPSDISGGLPATIAVAVCEAIEAATPLDEIKIKWPNDIVINHRKAGGILIESVIQPKTLADHVVIGIGLNVNNAIDHGQIRRPALMAPIAIHEACSQSSSLTELLLKTLQNIFDRLSHSLPTVETYNLRSCVNEKQVTIKLPDSNLISGTAIGIAECGGLKVTRKTSGSEDFETISSGTIQEIESLH